MVQGNIFSSLSGFLLSKLETKREEETLATKLEENSVKIAEFLSLLSELSEKSKDIEDELSRKTRQWIVAVEAQNQITERRMQRFLTRFSQDSSFSNLLREGEVLVSDLESGKLEKEEFGARSGGLLVESMRYRSWLEHSFASECMESRERLKGSLEGLDKLLKEVGEKRGLAASLFLRPLVRVASLGGSILESLDELRSYGLSLDKDVESLQKKIMTS